MYLNEYIYLILFLMAVAVIIIPIVTLIVILKVNKRVANIELQLQHQVNKLKDRGHNKIVEQSILPSDKNSESPTVIHAQSITEGEQQIDIEGVVLSDSSVDKRVVDDRECMDSEPLSIEETPPSLPKFEEVVQQDKVEHIIPANSLTKKEEKEGVAMEDQTQSAYNKVPHKDSSNQIENLFGGNFFAKIGILTLVLGVGFFVKYSIDQNWINEIGRVSIGFLIGALLIGLAHRLSHSYKVFSSILIGGGIAIFYVTIGLGYHEYAIFSSLVSFILSIAVTIFAVLLSHLYGRQELGACAVVGGFIVPLLASTGSENIPILYSYILILNCGMLAMSLNKNWKVVGALSFILTLLFFIPWLCFTGSKNYMMGLLFASLFYIQFYTLALILFYRSNRVLKYGVVAILISNNLAMLCSALITIPSSYRGLATLVLAAINAIVLVIVFRQMDKNRNLIYLMIGVVVSLISIAVPIQLQGYTITIFWSVEAILLLWLWHKSRIRVIYLGYVIMTAISLLAVTTDYLALAGFFKLIVTSEIVIFNKLFITGLVFTSVQWIAYFLLKRYGDEEWSIDMRLFKLSYATINQAQLILAVGSLFLVLGIEIYSILDTYEYLHNIVNHSFRRLLLFVYVVLFVGLFSLFIKSKKNLEAFVFLILILLFYTTFGLFNLRLSSSAIFNSSQLFYSVGEVAIHFIVFVGIVAIYSTLVRLFESNVKQNSRIFVKVLLTILGVIIVTEEFDSLVLLCFGTSVNFFYIVRKIGQFAHPILWGVLALALMVVGLKRNDLTMRKISIIFFGLIIVKFYLLDVWKMSQGGRIISFVVFGLILLIVSFMLQKIKRLVSKDSDTGKQSSIEEENRDL